MVLRLLGLEKGSISEILRSGVLAQVSFPWPIDFASNTGQEMSVSLLQEYGVTSAPWFLPTKFVGSTNSHLLKYEGPNPSRSPCI